MRIGKMKRGDFVKINNGAKTTCLPDQVGQRARFLERDIAKYDRVGLVTKAKDNGLICLSFGTEVYWYNIEDLTLV